MKNVFLHLVTVAMFVSISTFAAGDDKKKEIATSPCGETQQKGSKHKAKHEKPRHVETQEEKDFDRVLLGIFG